MKFREFLLSEAGPARPFGPRVSTIAGRLELPDLSAASQLGQTRQGGYQNFGDMHGWLAQQAHYNMRYPIETHGASGFKVDYSYEQMRRALTQLAEVIEGIYGILASDVTNPYGRDKNLSIYIRWAHFEGQDPDNATPIDTPGTNINTDIIRNVDIKSFVGRITGGTGMQAYILGDALGILEKAERLPQDPKAPHDSLIDIFIDRLRRHMNIALQNLTGFEKMLMSTGFLAKGVDHVMSQLEKSHLKTTLGTNPMNTAAMRKP